MAIADTPTVISASHLSSPNQGFRCGGRSAIGHQQPALAGDGDRHHERRIPVLARYGDGKVEAPLGELGPEPRRGILARIPAGRLGHEGERARILLSHAQEHLDLIRQGLGGTLRRRRPEHGDHHPGQNSDHRHDRHDEQESDLGAERVHVALS